jgi:hypothetical protein
MIEAKLYEQLYTEDSKEYRKLLSKIYSSHWCQCGKCQETFNIEDIRTFRCAYLKDKGIPRTWYVCEKCCQDILTQQFNKISIAF